MTAGIATPTRLSILRRSVEALLLFLHGGNAALGLSGLRVPVRALS
jgi:hypothetical protein